MKIEKEGKKGLKNIEIEKKRKGLRMLRSNGEREFVNDIEKDKEGIGGWEEKIWKKRNEILKRVDVKVGNKGKEEDMKIVVRKGKKECINGENEKEWNEDEKILRKKVRKKRM